MKAIAVDQAKREAPGPRSWPLLGNIGLMRGLLPFMESQWRQHGDVARLRLMGMPLLLLSNPDDLQRVLITHRGNYVKGKAYDGVRKFLGDGLVTLEGDAWKERRTLAQPSFHRRSLERLTAIMAESGARYYAQLEAKLKDGPQILDAHEAMVKLTLEVAINALFGRGTFDSGQVSYQSLNETMEVISSDVNGVTLPEWVPTPRNLKFHRTLRALNATMFQIIHAARSAPAEGTLLSMLLDARNDADQPLTDHELRDEVLTLFLAGHETTALTLTWLFALVEAVPEVLERMREEVDSVLAGRDPTFADVPRLPYLRQVVEETLRLRPPAAMIMRNALAEDEVGGFHVPAGDGVMPFIWAAHRHPDHWREPERFDPERFSAAESKGRHACSYMPFSVGPRICIGNSFALTEATILLAQLLNRFELAIQPCAGVKPVAIGTVRPSQPVRVKFACRAR